MTKQSKTYAELYAAYLAIEPAFNEFDRDDDDPQLFAQRANALRATLVRLDGMISRLMRERAIDNL